MRRFLLPLAFFLGAIAAWEAWVRLLDLPDYLIVAPSAAIWRLISDSAYIAGHLDDTVTAVVLGFAIGTVLAVPAALAVTSSKTVERTFYPIVVFIETLPKIAFAPLLLVWFGFSIAPKLILVSIVVFFPVLVDSMTGFKNVDPRQYYLARSMGANYLQTLFLIKIPSALPYIFSGMKISLILSVTVIIVVEYLMGNTGLGYVITRAIDNRETDLLYAVMIIAAAAGVFLNFLLEKIESRAMPWKNPA